MNPSIMWKSFYFLERQADEILGMSAYFWGSPRRRIYGVSSRFACSRG